MSIITLLKAHKGVDVMFSRTMAGKVFPLSVNLYYYNLSPIYLLFLLKVSSKFCIFTIIYISIRNRLDYLQSRLHFRQNHYLTHEETQPPRLAVEAQSQFLEISLKEKGQRENMYLALKLRCPYKTCHTSSHQIVKLPITLEIISKNSGTQRTLFFVQPVFLAMAYLVLNCPQLIFIE